mgnify:FL=1
MLGASSTYYREEMIFRGSVSRVMGTFLEMLIMGREENLCLSVWKEVCSILARDEGALDRFDASSEVSGINRALKSAGRFDGVSDLVAGILRECLRYRSLTGGLFDVTRKDMSALSLDGRALASTDRSIDLDFGGFAKGWALKEIREILDDAGIDTAFIDFGGSALMALGSQPGGDGWRIDLPSPYDGAALASFVLKDNALSTSGNTPGYAGHIIDPRDGRVEVRKMLSTVVSGDPVDAEVLSTALMIAGTGDTEMLRRAFPDAEFGRYLLSHED